MVNIIQFEGTDGTGKTYLSTLLYEHLKEQGIKVLYQHYPGEHIKFRIVNKLYPDNFFKDLECIWEIYNTRKNFYWKYDYVIEDRGFLSTLVYGDKASEEMVKGIIRQHEGNTVLVYLDYIYDDGKEENYLDVHKYEYRTKYRKYIDELDGYKKIIKIEEPMDFEILLKTLHINGVI